MTTQEWKQLLGYHIANKRKPRFRGLTRSQAKQTKHNASRQRKDGKKLFIMSKDALPWAF